jgi:hypothetical protein
MKKLVFFMVGLCLYLKGLNNLVFRFVVAVFSLTASFYAVTTLLALFVPFCPFHNPLSTVVQAGIAWYYELVWQDKSQAQSFFLYNFRERFSSKVQEDKIANNTRPDYLTGRALHWLITNSQTAGSADSGIKSIARVGSNSTMRTLLSAKPIMSLVAQRFTSCFWEVAITGTGERCEFNEDGVGSVMPYGQALANLAAHTIYKDSLDDEYGGQLVEDQHIDNEMAEAVGLRFQ